MHVLALGRKGKQPQSSHHQDFKAKTSSASSWAWRSGIDLGRSLITALSQLLLCSGFPFPLSALPAPSITHSSVLVLVGPFWSRWTWSVLTWGSAGLCWQKLFLPVAPLLQNLAVSAQYKLFQEYILLFGIFFFKCGLLFFFFPKGWKQLSETQLQHSFSVAPSVFDYQRILIAQNSLLDSPQQNVQTLKKKSLLVQKNTSITI